MIYLFAACAVVWTSIFVLLWSTATRVRTLEHQLQALRQALYTDGADEHSQLLP